MSIMYFKKRKLSVIFPLLLTACAGKGGFDSNIVAEDQPVKPTNTQKTQSQTEDTATTKDNQYNSGYEVRIPSRNLAIYDKNGQKFGTEKRLALGYAGVAGAQLQLQDVDKQGEDIAYIDLDNGTYLTDSQFKLTEEDKKNGFNHISLGFRNPYAITVEKITPNGSSTPYEVLKELNNALYYHGGNVAKSLPQNLTVKYKGVWYFVTDARRDGDGTRIGSEAWEVGRDYGATSDREDGTHISEFDVDFGSKKLTGSLKKKSRDGQEITRYNIEADVEKNRFKGKAKATAPITYKKVNTEDPIPENPLYFYENSDNVQGGFYGDNAEELVGGFSTGTPKKISTFVAFGAKRDGIAPNNLERKIDATKINVSTENHFVESNLDNYMDISKLVIDGKEFSLSAPSEYSIQECCKNSIAKNVKFGSFNKIDKDNRVNSKNSTHHRIASYENLISKYYPILVKLDLVKDISLTTLGDLKTSLNLENDDHEELINLLQQLDFTDPVTKQALDFDEKLIKVIKDSLTNLSTPDQAINIFDAFGFNLKKALTTLNMSEEDLKGLEDLSEELEDEEIEGEDTENEEEFESGELEDDDSEREEPENRENEKNKANEEKLNTLVSYIQKHIDVNNKDLISEIFNGDESLENIKVGSTLKIKSNVVKNIKENHSLANKITHKDIQTAIIISTLVEKLDFNDKDVAAILNARDEGEEDENIQNSNIATSKVDRVIIAYNRDISILDDLINKLPTDTQKNLQVNLKNSLMPSNIYHYGEHLFIQGNRTPKNEIPTGGQFTYKGKWQGVFKQNGAEKTETSTYKYDEETNIYTKVDDGKATYTHNNNAYGSAHTDGSADFSVDFSNKTLSGSLYNSHSADSNTQKITISDGKIEGTTFSAKAYTDSNDGITLNGIRDDSKLTKIKIDKTDVSGAFYGPQAKELGGSFIVNQYDVKREQPTISDNNGNKEINQKTIINETRGAVVFGATQVESK